jgi:hypothetical protein
MSLLAHGCAFAVKLSGTAEADGASEPVGVLLPDGDAFGVSEAAPLAALGDG